LRLVLLLLHHVYHPSTAVLLLLLQRAAAMCSRAQLIAKLGVEHYEHRAGGGQHLQAHKNAAAAAAATVFSSHVKCAGSVDMLDGASVLATSQALDPAPEQHTLTHLE
jgi:hypothetical protein